jgi:hypothetical protein
VRPQHPLQGQSLELFSWSHRQNILYLILVLPDGSRLLIPATWTDLEMKSLRTSPPEERLPEPVLLGTLSHLLHARKVVDYLLCKINPSEVGTIVTLKEERSRATATMPLARRAKPSSGTKSLERPCPSNAANGHCPVGQADQQGGLSDPTGGQR